MTNRSGKIHPDTPAAALAGQIINHRAQLLATLRNVETLIRLQLPGWRQDALEAISNARKATKL